VIVEREFRLATVHQGYLEPQVAAATWTSDWSLTIWTRPDLLRRPPRHGSIPGHPISKVRVVPTETGGAFGGKISTYLEPVAALLARKAGVP